MTALSNFTHLFEKKEASPLSKVQGIAWDRFLELGLPEKDNEAFRYIRLQHLLDQNFSEAPFGDAEKIELEAALLFHNGRYRDDLSKKNALPKEMIVLPLTKAWRTFGNFLQGRFLEGLKQEHDPYAVLNAALCEEGAFIYLPPHTNVQIPLWILHDTNASGALVLPRLHICLGKGAKLQLFVRDVNQGSHFQNGVIDVILEEDASLEMTTLVSQEKEALQMSALRATLKKNSRLKALIVTNGGKTFRHSAHVSLQGEGADASLKGITFVEEGREGHFHLVMEHKAPHTQSLQKFKNILESNARTSFEGKIIVDPIAQKTLAYQMNPNLLLGEKALAVSRPNLEIFADDVKASHGATCGELNQDLLFYLKTRGIDDNLAKRLLVLGFCKEVIDEISDESMRCEAESLVCP